MQEGDDKLSIAVIGGGPAGLSAALNALTVDSVGSVTIIEKMSAETFSDGPATFGIWLNSRSRGCLTSMPGDPLAHFFDHAYVRDVEKFICSTSRPTIREALFNTLIKEYGDSGRVHLAYSDEVERFDSASRTLHLKSGSQVPYDILAVADGIHSKTVETMDLKHLRPKKRAASRVVIKTLQLPALPNGEKNAISFYPPKGDDRSVFASIPDDYYQASLMDREDGSRYLNLFFHPSKGKNPKGVESADDMRRLLANMLPGDFIEWGSVRPGQLDPPTRDADYFRGYFESIPQADLEEFTTRVPRHFWTSRVKNAVDMEHRVALMGDSAGAMLGTLELSATRAMQDGVDLGASLKLAEAAVPAGATPEDRKQALVTAALENYARELKKERTAAIDLSLLAGRVGAWAKAWGFNPLPQSFGEDVADPTIKLSKVKADPRVRPFVWLARLQWRFSSISKPPEQVREWLVQFRGARSADSGA